MARPPAECGTPAEGVPRGRYESATTSFEARHAAAEALRRERLSPDERAVLAAHEAGDLVLG